MVAILRKLWLRHNIFGMTLLKQAVALLSMTLTLKMQICNLRLTHLHTELYNFAKIELNPIKSKEVMAKAQYFGMTLGLKNDFIFIFK